MIDLKSEFSIPRKEPSNILVELLITLHFVILNTPLKIIKVSSCIEFQEVAVKKEYYAAVYQQIVVRKLSLSLEMPRVI